MPNDVLFNTRNVHVYIVALLKYVIARCSSGSVHGLNGTVLQLP